MFDLTRLKQETSIESVEYFDTIPSTNTFAKKQLQAPTRPHAFPWLVLTEQQTQGRGQGANAWWSSSESLTFSLVVAPSGHRGKSNDSNAPRLLPLAVGNAVINTIHSFDSFDERLVELKWPNDILIRRKKIAGILVESIHNVGTVIGIGINLHQDANRFTSNSLLDATSLKAQTGLEIGKTEFLIQLLNRLIGEIQQLDDPVGVESLISTCNSRLAFRNEKVKIQNPNGSVFQGTAKRISESGAFVVVKDGVEHQVISGSIRAES